MIYQWKPENQLQLSLKLINCFKSYIIFFYMLFNTESKEDIHFLFRKGLLFLLPSAFFLGKNVLRNILSLWKTEKFLFDDLKIENNKFMNYNSTLSNIYFLEVLFTICTNYTTRFSVHFSLLFIVILVENNFQLIILILCKEKYITDWKERIIFLIGSLATFSLEKCVFIILSRLILKVTSRIFFLYERKYYEELISEYEKLRNYVNNFSVKFTCFGRDKKIKYVNPSTKMTIEKLGTDKFTDSTIHFLSDEDVNVFNNKIKITAFCTHSSLNPNFPKEIKELYEYLSKETNREKQLEVIDQAWDKLMEYKESYRQYTLFGVKKIDIGKGDEIVMESFFRINENNEIEMMCLDIKDLLTSEEERADMKYKTIFLNKVAHEFKNPLITINEIIKQMIVRPSCEVSQKCFKFITSLSDYMIILIKDFDYFSKTLYDTKDVDMLIEPIDAVKVIEFCESLFLHKECYKDSVVSHSNNKIQVAFHVTMEKDINKMILADEIRLKQVLINLLSNSFKFTKIGSISLVIKNKRLSSGNFLKFIVKDTGLGMEPSLLKQIESNAPFSKGQSRGNSLGSGLGLIIVKDILSKIGNDFKIKSNLGVGTKVSFLVPCARLASIEPYCENKITKACSCNNEDDKKTVVYDFNYYKKKGYSEDELDMENWLNFYDNNSDSDASEYSLPMKINGRFFTQANGQILRLLVVDDEAIIRKSQINVIKSYCKLNSIEIEIRECRDGIECIHEIYQGICQGIKYNAIITDQCMSFLQGSISARIIRELIKDKACYPIKIYLSTCLSIGENTEYKTFDQVLSKPLTQSSMKKIFEEI